MKDKEDEAAIKNNDRYQEAKSRAQIQQTQSLGRHVVTIPGGGADIVFYEYSIKFSMLNGYLTWFLGQKS